MKKLLSITLALLMFVSVCATFSSCSSGKYEIALITDKGSIDDKSFNQGVWEGIEAFAKEKDISHKYYKPQEASDAGYLKAIELAIENGAKVVVTPGFLFEVTVYEAQTKYPKVKFILLDGAPHKANSFTPDIKTNVASVKYSEEQSGYLVGYAAVKDGYRKLGFMGSIAVPEVQSFGYGYLQGIEAAANELGLDDSVIKVTYHYTGNFEENDTNKQTAKTMYQEGTEVIFACGGSIGKSVMSAAQETSKKVIGVDVDQKDDSDTVISSATKGLGASVELVLKSIYVDNKFDTYGGKTTYFSANNNGVGLPNDFSRFKSFNKEAYDSIFAKLSDGSIKPLREITITNTTGKATKEELTAGFSLKKVDVTTR